ncbi:MAG: hypothetical protein ACP5PP_08970 [Fervidobacterium sp.]
MAEVDINVELGQWLMRYRRALRDVGVKLADVIVEIWKKTATDKSIGPHVLPLFTTGQYTNSIQRIVEIRDDGISIEVFPTVSYAEKLEKGTSDVSYSDIERWAELKSQIYGGPIDPQSVFKAIKKRGGTLPTPISDYVGERIEKLDFEALIDIILEQAGLL